MVDFLKKGEVNNHHETFMSETTKVISYEENIRKEYEKYFEKLKNVQDERIKIIDDTINILRENGIYIKQELNVNIVDVIKGKTSYLPGKIKDEVDKNLVKIEGDQKIIHSYGDKLVKLYNSILAIKVPEYDEKDELEISITPKYKDSQNERVISIKRASNELVNDFELYKSEHRTSIVNDDDSTISDVDDLLNTDEISSIKDEDESLAEDDIVSKDTDEYIPFNMDDIHSLKEVASQVYGADNSWTYVYNYADNSKVIDNIAKSKNMSHEEIISSPGLLSNISIKFPTYLEEKPEKYRKVG